MPKGRGDWCAVAGCTNFRGKTNNISYFHFPKDPKLRREWIIKCCRPDKFNADSKNCTICSVHFEEEDFVRNMQAELLGTKYKPRLKEGSIPSQNLLRENQPSTSSGIRRRKRMLMNNEKKKRKDIISELLSQALSDECEVQNPSFGNEILEQKDIFELKKENEDLKLQLEEKDKEIKDLKETIEQKVEKKLEEFLSPNRIKLMLKKRKRVVWTEEEFAEAFTLRYLSKRAYLHVKDNLLFPLPGLSSLKRWAHNLCLERGVFHNILNLMEHWGKNLKKRSKLTVLMFDEMKVEEVIEYDQGHEKIVGPFSHATVVMARGLCSSWKQPIYVEFNKKVTKDLIFEIIDKLLSVGFPVVSVVNDCAPGNRTLWNDLGISPDKTSFLYKDLEVFFFPDAPCLLKLVRNWFLDTGFVLQNGTKISKELVEALIELTSSELNVRHKLTSDHIQCRGSQRQEVKLAAQLFSHNTASALAYYHSKLDFSKHAINETSNFIALINDWFDVMNSSHLNESKASKKPYGINLAHQNKILDDVYQTILGMRCHGKPSLQVFQKALLINIKSLKGLFKMLNDKSLVKYILTSKLNQDALENLFSQIRSCGGLEDHPTPINFLNQLRTVVLGKGLKVAASEDNTSLSNDEEFVLSNILKNTDLSKDLTVSLNESTDAADSLSAADIDTDTASDVSTDTADESLCADICADTADPLCADICADPAGHLYATDVSSSDPAAPSVSAIIVDEESLQYPRLLQLLLKSI